MQCTSHYQSPLGDILLAADDTGLTGLWFAGQRYYADNLERQHELREIPVLVQTKHWLDIYFSGREPAFTPPLRFIGTTFRNNVWKILCTIPYGRTMTYGEIAKRIADAHGLKVMSARAVGGAVACNPISVIVPCHRVIAADGSMTGYAGGIDRKMALLYRYEGHAPTTGCRAKRRRERV